MPWHRSTGYFVPAVWWRIFGQIGLRTLASLSLACRRSPGRQTGGSVFKACSHKAPENLQRHRAASRIVLEALQQGLFVLERTGTFPFRYHFQDLGIFERLLRTGWKETFLRPSIFRRLQTIQRRSRAGHIVVIESLRLNVLRKR